jgi:hypothetical protein
MITISKAQQDVREPTLRQHEIAMENGSAKLLKALWSHHPVLMEYLTGGKVPS